VRERVTSGPESASGINQVVGSELYAARSRIRTYLLLKYRRDIVLAHRASVPVRNRASENGQQQLARPTRPRWEAAARRQDTCPSSLIADPFRGSKRSRRRSPSFLFSSPFPLVSPSLPLRPAREALTSKIEGARHVGVAMVIASSATCGCRYAAGAAFLLYLFTSHYYN